MEHRNGSLLCHPAIPDIIAYMHAHICIVMFTLGLLAMHARSLRSCGEQLTDRGCTAKVGSLKQLARQIGVFTFSNAYS